MSESKKCLGKLFFLSIFIFVFIIFISISANEIIENKLNKDELLMFWRVSEFLIFISGASGIFSGMYCLFKKFKLI
jgi:hypothetical protein